MGSIQPDLNEITGNDAGHGRLYPLRKTQDRPGTSHIPVVLLTAKAGAEHKLAGLETGADDYLTKPFGLDELLLRVRNLLESRRRLREKYGRQVALNPKEIAVTSTDEQFLARTLSVMET